MEHEGRVDLQEPPVSLEKWAPWGLGDLSVALVVEKLENEAQPGHQDEGDLQVAEDHPDFQVNLVLQENQEDQVEQVYLNFILFTGIPL